MGGIRASVQVSGVLERIFGDTGTSGPIDRASLVSGTYNPVYYSGPPRLGGNYATNRCGILTDPSNLAQATGSSDYVFSTSGQVISDTAFFRKVSVSGPNITFNNCIFYGTDGSRASTAVCNSSVNATFNDCTFAPRTPQYNVYAVSIGAGGGTFRRCDVYGADDGICNTSGTGWTSQWNFIQCAIHDMLYFAPMATAPGGIDDSASHTDGIQFSGGYCYIEGCGIWAFFDMGKRSQAAEPCVSFGANSTTSTSPAAPYHFFGNKYTDTVNDPGDSHTPITRVGAPSIHTTSCVQLSPALTNIQHFEVTKSYLDGAPWPVNVNQKYWDTFAGFAGPFIFTDNHVGTNHRWSGYGTNQAIIARTQLWPGMTFSGNTDLATGAALTSTDLLKAG